MGGCDLSAVCFIQRTHENVYVFLVMIKGCEYI
jgi:hypothetical protein